MSHSTRHVVGGVILGITLALTGGCRNRTARDFPSATQPGIAFVDGIVRYRQRVELTPGALVTVELVELSGVKADHFGPVVAHQTIRPAGDVPILFHLPYEASRIEPDKHYGIHAVIDFGGGPMYENHVPAKFAPGQTKEVEVWVGP